MAKAKPTKHTAKELAGKAAEALTNKGGGKAGQADRKGGSAGHAKFQCHICQVQAPSLVSMQAHFESRHPKLPWAENADKCNNTHEACGGVTTAGVAIRGGQRNHHN
ncbi:hypothetical protein FOA52_000826 [Chlamydomonas sp. UWO 241]|nr:hypothetical protein FOA52_000826 [Chlamydomonas sp. UWO 241]